MNLKTVAPALIAGCVMVSAPGATRAQDLSATTPPQAFLEAQDALDRAWNSAGLSFAVAAFTDSESSGYGEYVPRSSSTFAPGEPIMVYAEPVGYAFSAENEVYSFQLSADYKLLNPSGQILSEEDGFAEFAGSGRSRKRELYAGLSFQFEVLPAGTYMLQLTINDTLGGTFAAMALPLTITAAE